MAYESPPTKPIVIDEVVRLLPQGRVECRLPTAPPRGAAPSRPVDVTHLRARRPGTLIDVRPADLRTTQHEELDVPEIAITAVPRSDFGKGAARRLRRDGQVPAVIYGKGTDLKHVALPGHELAQALRKPGLVLDVTLEGAVLVVAPRDVQRDPVRRIIEHLDLVIIDRAERDARVEEGKAIEAELAAAAEDQSAPKGDMPLEDETPTTVAIESDSTDSES